MPSIGAHIRAKLNDIDVSPIYCPRLAAEDLSMAVVDINGKFMISPNEASKVYPIKGSRYILSTDKHSSATAIIKPPVTNERYLDINRRSI